jgi:hypothetical protein
MNSRMVFQKSLLFALALLLLVSCSQVPVKDIPTPAAAMVFKEPASFSRDISPILQANLRSSQQNVPVFLEKASFYRVEVVIAEDSTSLTGHETIRYINNEPVDLYDIYLRLFPNAFGPYMKINAVTLDGKAVQPDMLFHGTAAKFVLFTPLRPGDSLEIALNFELQVPTDFTFSYGLFVYANDILSLYQFLPLVPVFKEDGWQVGEPNTMGDLSFNDISFFEVRVDSPASLTLAASGTRVSQKMENDRRIESFQAGPVRDFYLAASAAFHVTSLKWQDVVINSYAPVDMQSASDLVLSVAQHALDVYSRKFGAYPYSELDLVSAPMHGALGMEYSGVVDMSIDLYDPISGIDNREMLQFVTAHEIAHQWFFNLVGSDQVMEPWLDEGMAQFAVSIFFEDFYGIQAAEQTRESWQQRWQRIQNEPIPVGLPVSSYAELEYSPIIYGRAPLFIQSLREGMGAEKFAGFLTSYFQKFEWGIVTTQDFRNSAEMACSCSLEEAFGAWVYPKSMTK